LISVAAHDSGAGLVALLMIAMLLAVVGLLIVSLRFSLAGPMIVEDGRFHLIESWRLTRGHVSALLLVGLSQFGLLLLGEIVLLATTATLGLAGLGAAAGGFEHIPAFLRAPLPALIGKLAPFFVVYMVTLVPIAGGVVALFGAPWAKVYLDLKPDAGEAFA
jgi:hypothetical protein